MNKTVFARQCVATLLIVVCASSQARTGYINDEVEKTLEVFRAIGECQTVYGKAAIGPYIISMAQRADDVLAVMVLAMWAGLLDDNDVLHLDIAPWLIIVFAQRWGERDGERVKHYYVPESVGIATGMLITALHTAGLSCLTHTPNPMKFLNGLCDRPDNEKPIMILAVGHPNDEATVPAVAKNKKPLDEIMTVYAAQE